MSCSPLRPQEALRQLLQPLVSLCARVRQDPLNVRP